MFKIVQKLAIIKGLRQHYCVAHLDRRCSVRVPAVASLRWQRDGVVVQHSAVTSDWSRGGMFIQTLVPALPGQLIHLRLALGAAHLRVDATVMHRCSSGMGVQLDYTTSRVC